MAPSHIVALAPEPWNSSSGGASFGPQASTKVSPWRVGTVSRSPGTGRRSRNERYRARIAAAPASPR